MVMFTGLSLLVLFCGLDHLLPAALVCRVVSPQFPRPLVNSGLAPVISREASS